MAKFQLFAVNGHLPIETLFNYFYFATVIIIS